MPSRLDAQRAQQFGYSDEAWARTSERDRELLRLLQPVPQSDYVVNRMLKNIEAHVREETEQAERMGATFELNPDFQRGHVWDRERQVAYVENYLRGNAPRLFRFNCPSIKGYVPTEGDLHPYGMVCIDGLQRLTALRAFMADELPILGGLKASDLEGTVLDPKRTNYSYQVEIHSFSFRHELLDYYVALNAGGVVHSPEEIARVRALSEQAKAQAQQAVEDTPDAPRPKRRAKL